MRRFLSILVAGATGLLALSVSSASAEYRPDYCKYDHDHRSHAVNYYNYYPADRYYRAGPYRGRYSSYNRNSRGYRSTRGYRGDRYQRNSYGNGYGYQSSGRIVKTQYYPTRYNAKIHLTEKYVRSRRGSDLICTVRATGPDASYISTDRMRRIARQECSYRSIIRVYS